MNNKVKYCHLFGTARPSKQNQILQMEGKGIYKNSTCTRLKNRNKINKLDLNVISTSFVKRSNSLRTQCSGRSVIKLSWEFPPFIHILEQTLVLLGMF